MAMGDSISAAFAARGNPEEARDAAWSGGRGFQEQLTFPRLLRFYNKNVSGWSKEARLPRHINDLPHGDYVPENDRMNVAESSGAVRRGSLQEQWGYLKKQFKQQPEDFEDSWKVLTIWMTANDVCGQCGEDQPTNKTLEKWARGYDELLTNVTSKLKNVYVNLISTLDLSNVARIQRSNFLCNIEHQWILTECGCIDRGSKAELKRLDESVHAFNMRQHQIAADWYQKLREMGRENDIAVVQQGFMEGVGANLDLSFLNRLDCFHPSLKAHEDLGIGLWNEMLCTGDRKNRCGRPWKPDLEIVCPTENSVFYTGPDVIPAPYDSFDI